ncbi:uncharacterized protein LOC135680947 [Rhopilema esculentum]|uniref:uncharacterized protein LOC135680947 n=1 Tax=Rhopilema esculentum TaxID=499914 RepID=UPI0031E1CB62
MESLHKLIKIRGANRSVATKLEREALELLSEPGEPRDDERICRLETILELLDSKLKELKLFDGQIIDVLEEEEKIDSEVTGANEYEFRISNAIRKIKRKLHPPNPFSPATSTRIRRQLPTTPPSVRRLSLLTTTPLTPANPSSDEHDGNGNNSLQSGSSSSSHGNSNSKLPKLQLPRFSGDIVNFFSFWESFNAAVHENTNIPTITKFSYLKSYLDGQAARAIEGLPMTEANYENALLILQDRFGKKQKIISKHMDELLKLPVCQNDKPAQLRYVYDTINVHVRGLQSLGISSDQYGSLLIPVIMSRVPKDISLQIARHTSKEIWSISELLMIIKHEVEAREMRDYIHIADNKAPITTTKIRATGNMGTTSVFVSRNATKNIRCYFCSGNHYASDCNTIVDVNKRKEHLLRVGRCFSCLRTGHVVKTCPSAKFCSFCRGKHHSSICERKSNNSGAESMPPNVTAISKEKKSTHVLLQTAKATAVNPSTGEKCSIRILFDNGSQRSYVTEDVVKKLQLKTEMKETLNLNTFGSAEYKSKNCKLVSFQIELNDGQLAVVNALSYPELCSPLPTLVEVNSFPHLQGLELADEVDIGSNDHINVLIGADQYHSIVVGDVIRGENGPVAVKSKLGWVLSGKLESSKISQDNFTSANLCIENPRLTESDKDKELVDTLKAFWEVENTGLDCNKLVDSNETDKFCDIRVQGDRYEVGLPWKPTEPKNMVNNFEQCKTRLNSLHSRLIKDPELMREYDGIFKEQLAQGIIEKVPSSELDNDNVRFMPHFGVIRKDRVTSKVRVVFDASAKMETDNLSLNDRLERGPNLIPMLFDVLVKFRTKVIALTADIEKAFLQIGIKQEDRDFLRFLWYDEPQSANRSIVQLRYARLPFGLRPSPAVLGSVLLQHVSSYQEKNPEIVKVLKGLFVDDLSTGGETVDKAYEIYQQSKQVMKEGNFNLRKWNSNSQELIERIRKSEGQATTGGSDPKLGEEDQSYVQSCIGLSADNETVKILGLHWNSSSDEICYDFTEITQLAKTLPATKRSLLRLTAKIFDPLGILSVFTVRMKAMFQSLCLQKVAWDEELQGSARLEFNAFLSKLEQLSKVRIPRCLINGLSVRSYQIHGFSDASEQAYACVVYLRTEYENGEVDCRIIASKARVAPIKQVTIPKLELMGALLLAELMDTIRTVLLEELDPAKITSFYWVDSLVALCWIKNSKPWKQFVRNRVHKILELTDRSEWKFCPGVLNPADLPSRGLCGKDLSRNVFWFEGPEFLKQRIELWPSIDITDKEAHEIALKEEANNSHMITHTLSTSTDVLSIQNLVNIERFGSKRKLLGTLAWVFRFVGNCKASLTNQTPDLNEELRNEEIERAEYKLLSYIQREEFSEEYEYLRGKMVTKPPLKVKQFNLFLDNNGVIRARSRITNASVPDSTKTPILLRPYNWYSKLVIKEYHAIVLHSGVRDTLNEIRQRYWILRGREAVKKFKRSCTVCIWIDRHTIKSTLAPDLPDSRVDDGPPFTNTGLDFAGPLLIKVVAFLFANANSSEDLEELSLDDGYPRPVMYVDVPPKVNRNLEGTKSQEEEQEEKGKDEKYITEAEQDAAEKKHGKKGNRTPRFIEMKNIETRLFNPKLKKLQGRRRIIYQRQSRRRRRRRWWG